MDEPLLKLCCQERVVVLIDMDCFYVQVEQRDNPELWGKPVVVVQYNQYRGGGIIAISYEAREKGVKRGMRGADALEVCPEVQMVQVPSSRGKANLDKYRNASAEVFDVLNEREGWVIEKASVDEAYIDITKPVLLEAEAILLGAKPFPSMDCLQSTCTFGEETNHFLSKTHKNIEDPSQHPETAFDFMLCIAATLIENLRVEIRERTKFNCSAGLAQNKMLAKLSCGLNKPRKQTLLPKAMIPKLFEVTPVKKIRNLGGKLGSSVCQLLSIETMGELASIDKQKLVHSFGEKTGTWLHLVSKGIDKELVEAKDLAKSLGCGKNFTGKESLTSVKDVRFWLLQLAEELECRLDADQKKNHRTARSLTAHIRLKPVPGTNAESSFSRAFPIMTYDAASLARGAFTALREFDSTLKSSSSGKVDLDSASWQPPVTNLSLQAGRFEDSVDMCSRRITDFMIGSGCDDSTSEASALSSKKENVKATSPNASPGPSSTLGRSTAPTDFPTTSPLGVNSLQMSDSQILEVVSDRKRSTLLAHFSEHKQNANTSATQASLGGDTAEIFLSKQVPAYGKRKRNLNSDAEAKPQTALKKPATTTVTSASSKSKKSKGKVNQKVVKSQKHTSASCSISHFLPSVSDLPSCSNSIESSLSKSHTEANLTPKKYARLSVPVARNNSRSLPDESGYLPSTMSDIDPVDMHSLPPEIQFELSCFYGGSKGKRCSLVKN